MLENIPNKVSRCNEADSDSVLDADQVRRGQLNALECEKEVAVPNSPCVLSLRWIACAENERTEGSMVIQA